MNPSDFPAGAIYLGIDGGGSKCKARLMDPSGGREGVGIAGPANPFQDMDLAIESIVSAAQLAVSDAGLAPDTLAELVVGIGLAGVNIPRVHQSISAWSHPFRRFYLADDIHIACLGAHGGEDGAVIVAGTGSVAYTSINGVNTSIGGHGFPFGDKGSGAWMGLELLKAVLLAMDDLGPETALIEAAEKQLGVTGLGIIDAMVNALPRDYGALAPLVMAGAVDGDQVAVAIVREGATYLEALATRLLQAGADNFCVLGGLAPALIPWMREEITRHIVEAQGQPDIGALRLAVSEFRRDGL